MNNSLVSGNDARPGATEQVAPVVQDLRIGDILRQTTSLNSTQIEKVLVHQREHGLKFGESAVALGFVRADDVMAALARQFHYPYANNASRNLHSELVAANHPFTEEVEAFRELRSQLTMGVMAPEHGRCALAIVSANIGDGKTFVVANLAVSFSQLPGRTLLIDADMRNPRLHKVFGIENSSGLSGILSGRAEANVIRPVADLPNLYMLPVGAVPPNPLELVQHPSFGLLLQELLNKFDHVLVDTPAASYGADARMIASKCGAALIVGRKDSTRVPALQALNQQLAKGPTRIAGVVMNDF